MIMPHDYKTFQISKCFVVVSCANSLTYGSFVCCSRLDKDIYALNTFVDPPH